MCIWEAELFNMKYKILPSLYTKVCIATGGTITVVQCGVLCDHSHLEFIVTTDKQARYSRSIHDDKQHSSVFDNQYLTS
jgi:hypothetical protein